MARDKGRAKRGGRCARDAERTPHTSSHSHSNTRVCAAWIRLDGRLPVVPTVWCLVRFYNMRDANHTTIQQNATRKRYAADDEWRFSELISCRISARFWYLHVFGQIFHLRRVGLNVEPPTMQRFTIFEITLESGITLQTFPR